jgi:septal ring-binding cell division protein DamX
LEFAAVALESQPVRLESETRNVEPGVETEVVAASVVDAPSSWDVVVAEEASQTALADTVVAEPDAEVVGDAAQQQTPAPPRAVTAAAEAQSAMLPELASQAAQTAVERVSEMPVDANPEQQVMAAMRASGNETNPLLSARLQATRDWLQAASENQFSIQLLATPWYEHAVLEVFLRRRHRAGELQSVYVYESMIRNKVWYRVLYGLFPGRSNARQTLVDLPPELQRYRPFIRKMSDLETVS